MKPGQRGVTRRKPVQPSYQTAYLRSEDLGTKSGGRVGVDRPKAADTKRGAIPAFYQDSPSVVGELGVLLRRNQLPGRLDLPAARLHHLRENTGHSGWYVLLTTVAIGEST